MIIKGKSRSGPAGLAKHLLNAETNERITVLSTRGTVADDLHGALLEMDAVASGTHCRKPLYHAAISPGQQYKLTDEQREQAIDALEAKMGFEGHARAVIMHEKLGRQHFHVVWSRIDVDTMKATSDSHNYRKHEEVSRDLERMFGHERVQGAHHERDGVVRPDRTPSRWELRQEERTGIRGKDVKGEVTSLFRASDGAEAFRGALEDAGYLLAQGDRRDFVIVDHAGGIHSLARRIDGLRAADLREFMSPIDRSELPTADHAKEIAEKRQHEVSEHADEKRYSRGADYATQSTAALKDHIEKQKQIDEQADAIRMFDYGDPDAERSKKEEELLQRQAAETTKRQQAQTEAQTKPPTSTSFDAMELTDAQQARLDRLRSARELDEQELDHDDPDRQHEAPGEGRTRSR